MKPRWRRVCIILGIALCMVGGLAYGIEQTAGAFSGVLSQANDHPARLASGRCLQHGLGAAFPGLIKEANRRQRIHQ